VKATEETRENPALHVVPFPSQEKLLHAMETPATLVEHEVALRQS
jgi:hypothetical protein